MKLIEVKNNILLGLDKFAKENQFKIVKKDFAIKKIQKNIFALSILLIIIGKMKFTYSRLLQLK
ncbi:hypothetical protein [uncultured Brachyspira sp.]|uniref:hypothetical protein n=1 Tax=uncultured Brachyspira sp. TaxID=221953 RepID=UPI002595C800|nr:hypothetical protein [uncultured Brachyspira sp.]